MVTLQWGQVILQLDGLHRYDPLAAFEKESCTLKSKSWFLGQKNVLVSGPPTVRYKHRSLSHLSLYSHLLDLRVQFSTFNWSAVMKYY